MINLKIDGKEIKVDENKTILEAATLNDIYIPNLCYHPDLKPFASCRLCIVEIEGMRGFPTACTTKVREGMIVNTKSENVQNHRRNILWLNLTEHKSELSQDKQFKKIIDYVGVNDILKNYKSTEKKLPVLDDEPLYVRDLNKCVLCGRCVQMCQDIKGIGAIGFIGRGIETYIGTSYEYLNLKDAGCRFCGACVEVCPTGALEDKEICDLDSRDMALLPCLNTCPAHTDIPRYLRLIAEGKFQDSIDVIREKFPFPHVLGCVCDHPCEQSCRANEVNEPLNIKGLKKFVANKDNERWKKILKIEPDTNKKIAIIGSGPSGLTAAWFLRKKGHQVTIFEAHPQAGGMMRVGIPEYRLPREILNKEIQDILDIGIEIKLNSRINNIDKLVEEYDAVLLALGCDKGSKMRCPGGELPGVLDGVKVLRDVNLGKEVDFSGRIGILGGGNVAIDVARTAQRGNSDEVMIVYRRTRNEMPAAIEEIEECLEEYVDIKFLVNPVKVEQNENGKLNVHLIKMKLGEPDSSGRRRPVPIEGSEFIEVFDKFILAIGYKSDVPNEMNIKLNKWNDIHVNEKDLSTSREKVYAAGDVVTGPSSLIKSIQYGKRAASSIDQFLGGDGLIEQKYIPDEKTNHFIGRVEMFAYKKRAKVPLIDIDDRLKKGNPQVELYFDDETAINEAARCMRCQLRLEISQPPLPPEK